MKKSKPALQLAIADIDADLAPELVLKVSRGIAGVRLDSGGWLIRGRFPTDWRDVYRRWLQRLFPEGWIYAGGHHLSVHASPPQVPNRFGQPDGSAGRLLFAIQESRV